MRPHAINRSTTKDIPGLFVKIIMLPTYRNMFLAAGFSEQEINTVSDRLIESLLVFGDESKIKNRLQELLGTEFDELRISPIPVSDAAREEIRLARLIGQL